MRSLRKAALAGATAAAVAFGSISVASAQEDGSATNNESSQTQQDSSQNDGSETNGSDSEGSETQGSEGNSLSSLINQGLNLEGAEDANGRDIFGSTKDLSTQPPWAQVLYALTIIGGIGALVGLVLGPLDNFIKYGPFAN